MLNKEMVVFPPQMSTSDSSDLYLKSTIIIMWYYKESEFKNSERETSHIKDLFITAQNASIETESGISTITVTVNS